MTDWEIRSYGEGDLPAVMEIVRALAAAYDSRLGLGMSEMRQRMQGPPDSGSHHAIVVTGPPLEGTQPGGLLGAGSFSVAGSLSGDHSYFLHFWGHPIATEQGVEYALVARLLELIRQYDARPGVFQADDVRVFGSSNTSVPSRRALFESFGMNEERRFLIMARSLRDPIAMPIPVHGVTLRRYRHPEDNAGACAAYNEAFSDHWGHYDWSQESWGGYIADPSCRLNLSWLAEIDGKPGEFAGFCICSIHDDENKQKGVKEGWLLAWGAIHEWLRPELLSSLVLRGLHSLNGAGMNTALLNIDSEYNSAVNVLYDQLAFRVRRRIYFCGGALKEAKI